MKKLFILTTFLSSLMMSSMAHAEWTRVTEDSKGDIYYVDFERTKKHNGKYDERLSLFWANRKSSSESSRQELKDEQDPKKFA